MKMVSAQECEGSKEVLHGAQRHSRQREPPPWGGGPGLGADMAAEWQGGQHHWRRSSEKLKMVSEA